VTNTIIKHVNKSFLSRLGGFFPHFSLRVEGWLWIGWVVGFGCFECFLFFMVVGARDKLRSTLLTLILTHFLAQNSFLKMCSQIGNLLMKLGVLFGSMEKLTLERDT
jgi:bacteriorhodopsin